MHRFQTGYLQIALFLCPNTYFLVFPCQKAAGNMWKKQCKGWRLVEHPGVPGTGLGRQTPITVTEAGKRVDLSSSPEAYDEQTQSNKEKEEAATTSRHAAPR